MRSAIRPRSSLLSSLAARPMSGRTSSISESRQRGLGAAICTFTTILSIPTACSATRTYPNAASMASSCWYYCGGDGGGGYAVLSCSWFVVAAVETQPTIP